MKISSDQIRQFSSNVLLSMGVSEEQLDSVVRNIIWNELDGRTNFGLQRLPVYVKRLSSGGLNPSPKLEVSKLTDAVSSVDGDNGFGQFASEVGMRAAIASAKRSGVGVCTVKRSNFFGSGAYYVNMACTEGLVAIAMSNSYPKVAAHGGMRPVLGTNPFAFGAPKPGGDALIADFATSTLAGSSVRELLDGGETVPPDAIVGEAGEGDLILKTFGGAKGFSISLMVEMLAGVLAGAGVGRGVNSMYKSPSEPGENGHFLLAIDVSKWMSLEDFASRVGALEEQVSDPGQSRLPGALRREARSARMAGGVEISKSTEASLKELARSLNLADPFNA